MKINVSDLERISQLKGRTEITDEDLAFLINLAEQSNAFQLQLTLSELRLERAGKAAARYKDALTDVLIVSKAAIHARERSTAKLVEIAKIADKSLWS